MPLSDTTPEAQAIQERILRAMSGEQRLLLAWDMSVFARELARAGIRDAHPEWTEALLPAPLPAGLP